MLTLYFLKKGDDDDDDDVCVCYKDDSNNKTTVLMVMEITNIHGVDTTAVDTWRGPYLPTVSSG